METGLILQPAFFEWHAERVLRVHEGTTHQNAFKRVHLFLGAQKLTRSSLNGVSERDFWKANLPFSSLLKILYLRGENCLQNAHFYKQKGPCLKRPLNWTGSVFPLLIFFGIEMSFLWCRGGLSLLFGVSRSFFGWRDSALRRLALRSSPSWDQPVHVFWGLDVLYIGGQQDLDTFKKIKNLDTKKKDISIPTKRVTTFKLGERRRKFITT